MVRTVRIKTHDSPGRWKNADHDGTNNAGYLLVYPQRSDVVFENGCDEKLKDYFFGKKRKPHRFCPECSSSILIDFLNSDVESQRGFLAMNVSLRFLVLKMDK